MSWKGALLDVARRSRLLRAAGATYGRGRLTVLAYHRVIDHTAPGFDTMRRNVSATPEAFDGQMKAVAGYFSPVSLDEVLASLSGGPQLPARPLLVTFDDGYRDNLDEAFPILAGYRIPATIFLATAHIGTTTPFSWDLVAYCFAHSAKSSVSLPLLGVRSWSDERDRDRVLAEWIEELKRLPDDGRKEAEGLLPALLEVDVAPGAFDGLLMDWDDVRGLHRQGIAFGGHTRTHPILTRVPPEKAEEEIAGSKRDIERELGTDVLSFAYPNGQPSDISPAIRAMVANAGYRFAVTLSPGPARPAEVRADPLMVRRVFVHHKDHPSRFAAKVMGLARMGSLIR